MALGRALLAALALVSSGPLVAQQEEPGFLPCQYFLIFAPR